MIPGYKYNRETVFLQVFYLKKSRESFLIYADCFKAYFLPSGRVSERQLILVGILCVLN